MSLIDNTLGRKTALITGASRGIGRAIAIGFAEAGFNVFLVATNPLLLSKLTDEINAKQGGRAATHSANVRDFEALSIAFCSACKIFDAIDVVVANAGVNKPSGDFCSLDIEDWKKIFDTNVLGLVNTCKLAIQNMKINGGNIITIGSGIGHNGAAKNAPYAASKAASWIMTKSLAAEVAAIDIRVNELIPGPVKTDMNPNVTGGDWKNPEDVVPLALFLANQVSKGPTGQSFSLMRK